MLNLATKFYGIYLIRGEHGWWLHETQNGSELYFDHKPTEQEIENWRNELIETISIIEENGSELAQHLAD